MNRQHPPQHRGFRKDIQGMRTIAVLLVLLYHAGVPFLSGGFIGVDVFFVISGFLITTHILASLEQGRLQLRDFWSRRVRRLIPAAWTVAALSVIAGILFLPKVQLSRVFTEAAATFAYVPNVLFAMQGTDYLANDEPSVFQHYWSLGIEEQFYLLWPVVLLAGYLLGKRSRRAIWVTILSVTLLSFIASLIVTSSSQPWAFFSLPTRAWELSLGGLVALITTSAHRLFRSPFLLSILSWSGLALIGVAAFTFDAGLAFPGWYALIPSLGASALLLGGSGQQHPTAPTPLLSFAPMQFVGKISYSLYLVHWPLLIIPQSAIGWQNPLPLSVNLLLVLATFPLAWLSWKFVEEPGRSNRRWWAQHHTRSLGVAVLGAGAVLALSIPASTYASSLSLSAEQSATELEITTFPAGTPFVPSNLTPDLQNARDDNASIYGSGCHLDVNTTTPKGCFSSTDPQAPLVVLFGDSHAASWHPALELLAEDGILTLVSHTKSSCPSAEVEVVLEGGPYTQCAEWRENVIQEVLELQPEAVVLANYSSHQAQFTEDWEAALSTVIGRLHAETKVLVIQDVPVHPMEPVTCLSEHLNDADACATSYEDAVFGNLSEMEQRAADATGASYLKVEKYLCDETCPLILGDTLVYRDRHHLTATFSREMAPVIEHALFRE